MAGSKEKDLLFTWTKLVPVSEGQDPLGLQLRVTARLGANLLHCITSITPRARYYSLLPWIIMKAQEQFQTQNLREAVSYIEKSFTTGCLLHHEGRACTGGGLIGSEVLHPWYEEGSSRDKWPGARYAKIPALGAYYTSLVNLHVFIDQKPEDLSEGMEETTEWNGVYALSEIGQDLVSSYAVAIKEIDDLERINSASAPKLEDLKLWGKVGGLCELRNGTNDRQTLEDLFFNRMDLPEKAHDHRRDSLFLLLHLSDQFQEHRLPLDTGTLCAVAYFGSIFNQNKQVIPISLPEALHDTAMRWRMFYFHQYLSYALEYLFANIVRKANDDPVTGITVEGWVEEWLSPHVSTRLNNLLDIDIDKNFLSMTPREFFASAGVRIEKADPDGSAEFDQLVRMDHKLSEWALHTILQGKKLHFTPESCVLSTWICILTVMRYEAWYKRDYGNWLAQAARSEPYENVTVPVVAEYWRDRFGDFWNTRIVDLAKSLLHRFVIGLHLALAYKKSGAHFYLDGDYVIGRGKDFAAPQLGNPRLRSAIQILWDLGLLEDDPIQPALRRLTDRGKTVLKDFIQAKRVTDE